MHNLSMEPTDKLSVISATKSVALITSTAGAQIGITDVTDNLSMEPTDKLSVISATKSVALINQYSGCANRHNGCNG